MPKSFPYLLFCVFFCFFGACYQRPQKQNQPVPAPVRGEEEYLSMLTNQADFDALKGLPLSNKFTEVDAIKVVYDLNRQKLFFMNSRKYPYHYNFCADYLGYSRGLSTFNTLEYSALPGRNYLLANLNYYHASDIYTLEFFVDDQISAVQIKLLLGEVAQYAYFKDKLYILSNGSIQERLAGIDPARITSVDRIFGDLRYQPMVCAKSYGYFQKVGKSDFEHHNFTTKDIIFTDFLPNDLPFCQGVLTTEFQTPLSHINVLSQNRKTPNCADKRAWNHPALQKFIGKLVSFEVKQDSFYLKEVSVEEANAYWLQKSEASGQILHCNTKKKGLLDIKRITMHDVDIVGGKAANFGELEKIVLPNGTKIPIPEAAFAIPFYYYKAHIERYALQPQIDLILQSDSISQNRTLLFTHLKALQDSILAKPLDPVFLQMVVQKLKSYPAYTEFRFRSSTNAEDIPGFSGAGLYTSKTGSLVNPEKSVEKAIKKVWASLWSPRAFDERINAKIDQKNLAMGVLVHRAFGTEEVNGVAITKDLYRKSYPAFTINAQKGEASVVSPEKDEMPEQFLIKYSIHVTGMNKIAIDYLAHSPLNGYQPLLQEDEIQLLAVYLDAIKRHFYFANGYEAINEVFFDFAMDIEFKLDKHTRKIYIKQARSFD